MLLQWQLQKCGCDMRKVTFFVIFSAFLFAQTHNHIESNTESTQKDSKIDYTISQFYTLKALDNNEKIKQLNLEIQSLESKAKSQAKWENPRLNIGYNNAEISQPFNLNANDMQNIFVAFEQDLDMNGKRKILSNITQKEAQIKLLELKNLRNKYIFTLLSDTININKNKKILEATNSAIHNINVVLESLKSSNYNPLQLQRLNILKAKLQIKQNEILNILNTSHISISETSFESATKLDIKGISEEILRSMDYDLMLDSILKSNYEIKAEMLRESISLDSIALSKSQKIPDLRLGVSYMYRVSRADMFGVTLSMPLAIYGKENHDIDANKALNLIAKSKVIEAQNKIKHNVLKELNNFKTLSENLNLINKVLLPSNEQIINLYSHHATSKANLFQEFYNALNDKVEAQILRLEILAQMNIIYWNLESLKGE